MNWSIFKKIAGAALIVVGLLALATPLTPGGWLVFVGAELLGIEMLSQRRVTEQYQKFRRWRRSEAAEEELRS